MADPDYFGKDRHPVRARQYTEAEVQALVSKVYDMGFKCAVGYNDNYVHFQGEQRLRVMRKDFERAGILFDPV